MLTHRQIVFQVFLMDTAKRTQEVAGRRPQPFNSVGMYFTHAIIVVVSRPFMLTMTDRPVWSLDLVVTWPFIRVTGGPLLRAAVYMLLQSGAIGMLADPQARSLDF